MLNAKDTVIGRTSHFMAGIGAFEVSNSKELSQEIVVILRDRVCNVSLGEAVSLIELRIDLMVETAAHACSLNCRNSTTPRQVTSSA